jgi:hypothetical protein
VFGGGKSIRESRCQSHAIRVEGTSDPVITGAVVLDLWGVVKADVGIRDGRIVTLGKAGNPETMDGVHPDLVIGPSTEIMAGNGMSLTARTIDTHVHYVVPDLLEEALAAGTTAVVGGGSGPTEGSKATLATSAPGGWRGCSRRSSPGRSTCCFWPVATLSLEWLWRVKRRNRCFRTIKSQRWCDPMASFTIIPPGVNTLRCSTRMR